MLFCPHQWGQKRPGPTRLYRVFGALFRYARTLTHITTGLHLHASTCSYMSTDRSRCSPDTVQPWRESLRILCQVFIRKIHGLLLSIHGLLLSIVLKMSCSATASALKSCLSWLCGHDPSSPPRCDAHCRRTRNLMQVPRDITKWPILLWKTLTQQMN